MLYAVMLNVIMLSVVMLNAVMLYVITLSVITRYVVMLNVVMLSVIMLKVVAPSAQRVFSHTTHRGLRSTFLKGPPVSVNVDTLLYMFLFLKGVFISQYHNSELLHK
jgi:hypothetical protein